MSVKRLTKMANDIKKYHNNNFKSNNDVNIVFKIAGAGSGKVMVMKNFINVRDEEEINNITNYFDDFYWCNDHKKIINDDIDNSISNFKNIWFDCYVEYKNNKLPGDGNSGFNNFCFYDCLAECGIIQRYKNHISQKGEKHEIKLYEDLIRKINSYATNKLNLNGIVNISDIPTFERHFKINIYVNKQRIGNKNYSNTGNIWLNFSDKIGRAHV